MCRREEPVRRYEDGAEFCTNLVGYVCRTCGRQYAASDAGAHAARYCCCTELRCNTPGCEERVRKHAGTGFCPGCDSKRELQRYLSQDEVAWDGQTPLASGYTFFFDLDSLLEHLETDSPTAEEITELRLVMCTPHHPAWPIQLSEWFSDYLGDEQEELPGDWETAEKAVNDYLDAVKPLSWRAGNTRPTTASILAVIAANKGKSDAGIETISRPPQP
jgi:hypothetical protein